MSAAAHVYERRGAGRALQTVAAWVLGVLWVLPLLYALWTAFHPSEFSTRFVLAARNVATHEVQSVAPGVIGIVS